MLRVDPEADALYLTLGEALAAASEEVAPGVVNTFEARKGWRGWSGGRFGYCWNGTPMSASG